MKNGALKSFWNYWFLYKSLCLIEGIFYCKRQTNPHFETVYQMLVPWEGVSNVHELLHDSPSSGRFVIEKTCQMA